MLAPTRLFTPALIVCAFIAFQDWMGVNTFGVDQFGLRAATPCADWKEAGETQRRNFLRSRGLRMPGYKVLAESRCELYPGESLADMTRTLRAVPASLVSQVKEEH